MYLDSEGTLWSYTENLYYYPDNDFAKRYEIMTDVADWQEGGYYDERNYSTETIQILRKDGSLWLWNFNEYYENGTYYTKPGRLEKLEDSGVAAVYPNSYLTEDGGFYRLEYSGESELVAENVVRVMDNTAIALAQDASGNYYTTRGKVKVSGTVKEMTVGSYFNPDYIKLSSSGYYWSKTGQDMIASYLLMENGTLYRSKNSAYVSSVEFEVLDTGVTKLEKDYYWKGSTAYAFTGQSYASYIGNGIGKGLYPITEEDGSTTLYVNGVPYLTKVADWTVGDSCIYAVRLDNTLWQFDDENKPHQVDMAALSTETKDSPKVYKEIDITDLEKKAGGFTISWTAVEGAASYELDTYRSANSEDWTVTGLTETSYSFSELNMGSYHYFRVRALNSAGEECGRSWKYYTYLEYPQITFQTVTVDTSGKTAAVTAIVEVQPAETLGGTYTIELSAFGGSEEASGEEPEELKAVTKDITQGGTYTFTFTGIDKTRGYYYLSTSLVDSTSYTCAHDYYEFDMEEHVYLTEKEIPDDAFRAALQELVPDLDTAKLKKRTNLTLEDPKIQDLTGLQYLSGLNSLYIYGLTDVDYAKVSFPASLTRLSLEYCGLTTIPDLTGLTNLTSLYLHGNRIPESEFTLGNAKLQSFFANYKGDKAYWLKNQADSQLGDPVFYLSDTYYQTSDGAYSFYTEVGRMDARNDYQIKIYEGETLLAQASSLGDVNGRLRFMVSDLGISEPVTKQLRIVIIDLSTGETAAEKTGSFTFAKRGASQDSKAYIPASFDYYYVSDLEITEEQYNTLKTVGNYRCSGAVVPAGDNDTRVSVTLDYYSTYDIPEEYEIFAYTPEEFETRKYVLNLQFPWQDSYTLTPGMYDLVALTSDDTELLTLPELLECTVAPIYGEARQSNRSFDCQGEYLYVTLEGEQLGTGKPEVTLTTLTGEPAALEGDTEIFFADGWTYRFHLKEEYRKESSYRYEINAPEAVGMKSGKLQVNRSAGYVYGLYWDTANKGVLGYASAAMPEGTNLTLNLYEWDDSYENKELKRTVNGTVKNGQVFFPVKTASDEYLWNYDLKVLDGSRSCATVSYVRSSNIGREGTISLTGIWKNGVLYPYRIKAGLDGVIEFRELKTGKLLKTTGVPESKLFADVDVSGLEASTLYLIHVSDANGDVAWVAPLDATPKTTNLDFALKYEEQEIAPVLSEERETGYQMDYDVSLKGKVLMLETTTVGNAAAKLKVTSSDTSVVTAALSGHTIKLTVKGSGTARITVQALDTNLTETVTLSLRDYTPRLDVTSVSLNQVLTTKAIAAVYPAYGTVLENISIDETKLTAKELSAGYAGYFTADLTEDGIRITLDEAGRLVLKNASYRLPLSVTVREDAEHSISGEDVIREIPLVLTVKLSSTKPKITAKQTEKINLFYTDTKASYSLTVSAGKIQKAELDPASGAAAYFDTAFENGVLTFMPKAASDGRTLWNLSSKELGNALKAKLILTVGDEGETGTELVQNLTIGKDTSKPSVTLTTVSGKVYKFAQIIDGEKQFFYTGTHITFQPLNKKTKEVLEHVEVKLTGYEVTKKGITTQNFSAGAEAEKEADGSYLLTADEATGEYKMYFVGDATAAATLTVQGANWAEPVKVTYKATVTTSAITGKLSASSVSLNKNYTGDQKTLALTTNLPYTEFEPGDWTVTPPKKVTYNGGLVLEKSADGKGLTVRLDEAKKAELTKGTYKISIPLTFTFEDGVSFTPKALSLTVNVLEEDLTSKCVKWKNSGKLDVRDRAGSGITAAPTISKLNAVLEAAELSEADKEAGLDEKLTVAVEDGKLKLQLISGVDISTKEKFVIHPILTLKTESGEEHQISVAPAITVQPTQSSTKITLGAKTLTMYGAAYGTQTKTVNYTLKGAAGTAVERVESVTAGFEAELLEAGKIELRLTDSALAAKTYTVKMNVYLKDQAVNQKPISVSIKVVLKK